MKKIIHIVEAFGGGIFIHLSNLTNYLCNDFEIYIAYGLRAETHNDFKSYFDARINFVEIKNFTSKINPRKDLNAIFEIRNLCKTIKPDIIHLHSSKAGVIGRIGLNSLKTPMLYSPHGWSFLKEDDSQLVRLIYKFIESIFSRFRCDIIATSQGEYDEAIKLTKKSILINNGVSIKDLELYVSSKNEVKEISIYTLGRICYQKNPYLFNEIAKSFPDIKFYWVGDGDMRNELTSPNIEIIGWGSRSSALDFIEGKSIFLLTSLWEGLPLSLLEAMFLGKICIVSSSIGNRDVINDGINGFVCNTLDRYVEIISNIAQRGVEQYNELISRAQADILNEYNTQIMSEKYALIYNKYLPD